MLPITAVFASLLTLYYVRLAFKVIRLRKSNQVSLGSAGHTDLERAIRVHGNFAEYVPLGLVLLGLLESQQAHPAWLIVLGTTLLLGRLFHAQALPQANLKNRVRGMQLTFITLIMLSLLNLAYAIHIS